MNLKFLAIIITFILVGCESDPRPTEIDSVGDYADTLYFGGDILTLAAREPEYVESLVVQDGEILFVGSKANADKYVGPETTLRDLNGATLLPGFIDSHSHFQMTALKLSTVNLDPPPAGGVTSIPDIQAALRERLDTSPPESGQWLFGWGYDNAMLTENRHPTKADLDAVSTDVPIAVFHFSAHMVVLNSLALDEIGIDESSVAPEGGEIRRLGDTNEPNGVLEETASLPVMLKMVSSVQGSQLLDLMSVAQEEYSSNGFTTISDMAGTPETVANMKEFADSGALKLDLLVAMFFHVQSAEETSKQVSAEYENGLRIAGGKVNLDGGTPGRTAFLREPYFTQEPGMDPDYRGYSSIENQKDLNALVESYYELATPIFIHALGDAAIDQAIAAVSHATDKYPRDDIRTQLIHLQVLTEDQIESLKKLDVTLTFQNTHNFYFADYHNDYTLGPERTAKLCPLASAVKAGFSVSIHHDSPIHPVSQLDLIWIATNRTGRSGTVYGPEERLSTYQALRASTIEAAYQYFEEDTKGSLEIGKLADMIVLDRNPLKVPAEHINDLRIMETIKAGVTVWVQ